MKIKAGVICDVCGKYILPLRSFLGLDETERINEFKIKGVNEMLHCDNKCRKLLNSIDKDWTKLPKEGRLYEVFERTQKSLSCNSNGN